MEVELLEVSQADFDRSRAAAGYPLAPTARELCRRVGISWPEVKLNAAEPGRDHARVLGNVAGEDQERGRRPEDLVSALRSVARRLQIVPAADDDDDDDEGSVGVAAAGTASALPASAQFAVADIARPVGAPLPPAPLVMSTVAYDVERELMLAEDRRRRHGRRRHLPTTGQIIRTAGSWTAALELAGLPTPGPEHGKNRGLTLGEALELFFRLNQALPTYREILSWAHHQGVPISRHKCRWRDELELLRARWAARGVVVPERPPPQDERADYTLRDPRIPRLPADHQRLYRRNEDELVDAVAAYLDQLSPTARATAPGYRAWSEGRSDRPSISTITRKSKWTTVLAAARAKRAARANSSSA